ncbi:hypothetical protein F5B22DRAFT_496164 [Xylaria bambusicola]|uniref:uncharacterized protein n=1 Tax=Xylaria bambusicola TaxID=326684 RepID=UPI0020085660|nr:uncharacterized protein F5B22DRAFT_496164 [Xylaria bambusicola]KAI0505756.1 hypothetical protein F5B22DRAFT_496164 [Xylaria bambusicola]
MHILTSLIIALIPLTIAKPHPVHQAPNLSPSQCPDPSAPNSFTFSSFAYLRYTTSDNPMPPAPQPNTTQLVFVLENASTGVSTGCAIQNMMDGDGNWADDSRVWYQCVDRAVTGADGVQRAVRTRAHVIWDEWRVAVNQTWACDDSTTVSQFAALTLTPTCSVTTTSWQNIKSCEAPDVVVSTTSHESTIL